MSTLSTECCITGGGPSGLMLGYLLARQGVEVIVLEKHKDFLRDFRGDTVHPSTLELFHELGLLDGLLARPHQTTERVSVNISGVNYQVADFGRLRTQCKFIAMMPQWDFLDHLADEARTLPNFQLMMSTKAEDLIQDGGRVVGVRAKSKSGTIDIHAPLSVAADGRGSRLRDVSGLEVEDLGAPIDVFWMRLPRTPDAEPESLGRVSTAGFLVLINRGDYWQCALPFAKGHAEAIRAEGLDAFKNRITEIAPMLAEATQTLTNWDDVKLLSVQVNRLKNWWRDGLLCIGDCAHAMSPIGGVGINLAVQDAVAAARILGPVLRAGRVGPRDLASVQKRREWPAKITQRLQIAVQNRVLVPILDHGLSSQKPLRAPLLLKALDTFPVLRGLPARAIGLGFRPEHWHVDES